METKNSKIFAKKLIALFLSVLMALSCFTGALTAFAASVNSDKDYHDDNLASNFMAWAETTDEQTCEALLDYADLYLEDIFTGLLGTSHLSVSLNYVVVDIEIDAYMDSIDGLYDLIRQADALLDSYGSLIGGDVKNIDLSPIADLNYTTSGDYVTSKCGRSYRQLYSAKELVMALAKVLYKNSNDFNGKNVVGQFIKGSLSLGTIIEGVLGDDVYGLLQSTFNMWDGYESNLVYNIVANLMFENTKWFDDATLASYKADLQGSSRTYKFNFDDVLFDVFNTQFFQEIHAEITYPNYVTIESDGKTKLVNDSSKRRYERICKALGKDVLDATVDQTSEAFKKAAKADAEANNYSYNPNIIYFTNNTKSDASTADMDTNTGCVYLFQYRDSGKIDTVSLTKDETLYAFAFDALEMAWNTCLQDTLGLVHVNYDVDRGNGSNFDNQYFYWVQENGVWDYDDWTSNYSASQVEAWANAVYAEYECSDADEFLANVKHTFEYDRGTVEDGEGNWQDIDATTLFNKLRYNPLADLYFNMQTGPINLYFEQTGISSISDFFETAFTKYDNMVAGFNDALVAVTEVIFPDSANIGYGTEDNKVVDDLSVPEMKTTGNTTDQSTVASTLVSNFLKMFEYCANCADANILNTYYETNSITSLAGNLSEANFEEAMVPLLVSCINQISMTKQIHDEKWDSCKDAEGVAIVVLEEYLSYVLPDKDYSVLWTYDDDGFIVANSGEDLFQNAVMPMCRDALGYVIASVVPCRTASGDEWNVYTCPVDDSTTIFDILNSVVCYYTSQDNFSDGTKGKAVASLLGVVNSNGKCLVSMDNDIWTNLDNIVNSLFPVIGTLQYGTTSKAGKASSKELIYDDLINGILDIGDVNANTGKMGITTLLEEILTIVTADPISTEGVDVMIYDDLIVPTVNNLFGARYSGQGYDKVIPYSSWYDKDAYSDTKSSTPFDSLLTTSTLGHYSASNDVQDSNDTGVLGILICNIYELFGGQDYSNDGTKGCWTGAMFAVEAVNNFIPSFVPELSDHTLSTASAEVDNASQSGLKSGSAFTATTLDITNNAMGLNRFYRTADGTVKRDPRYFISIDSIDVASSNGSTSNVNVGSYDNVVAPEKTLKVSLTGTTPSEATTYTFTVTYSIFKGEMNGTTKPTKTPENTLYEDLTCTAYLYLTTEKDWQNTLYTGTSGNLKTFDSAYIYTGTSSNNNSNEYTSSSKEFGGGSKYLLATTPNQFIIPMSNAQSATKNSFLVTNVSISFGGSDKSFDGVFASLQDGEKYYPVSNGSISSTLATSSANKNIGYAAIDKTNGNILNYNLYDYTTDNGATWNRGDKQETGVYGGYTAEEINNLKSSYENFGTRYHVAWTIDEALASGFVYGVEREAAAVVNGVTTYTYSAVLIDLATAGNTSVASGLKESTALLEGTYEVNGKKSISWGTPTPGIYFATAKQTVSKASSGYYQLFEYDGTTSLSADEYDMAFNIYTTDNNNLVGTIKMIIADDTGATTLETAYNKDLATTAAYTPADFSDFTDGESETYNEMQAALASAVKTISTPINTKNASTLGSTMVTVPVTSSTTNAVSTVKAYKPIKTTTALPATLQVNAVKGSDGYWYYDDDCTIPVYSADELTSSDVKNGKDATGAEVTLVDGTYYYANAVSYEYEWDTDAYSAPYYQKTSTQATNSKDEKLYNQTRFTTYDSNGKSMDSNGNWTYMIPNTTKQIKENDGNEYRGLYQLDIDNLAYHLEQLQSKVDTSIAQTIVTAVSDDREGMNSVNYDVASYEKMVQVAKDAEKLVSYEVLGETTYAVNADGEKVEVKLSDESTSINTLYEDEDGNLYKNEDVTTEYDYDYTTTKAKIQIDTAVSMYQEFKSYVIPRNYIGDKLEAEIKCATGGYDYSALDYTQTLSSDDEVESATVTSTTATDAKYGAWVEGNLENSGEEVYSDASWANYLKALSSAIKLADLGNSDPTNEDAQLSDIYEAKKALQIAENNLAPSEGVTISGTITIATDLDGTTGTAGIVGINVCLEDGTVVATSDKDGKFEALVPVGTTKLIISGDTTIDREVTISGDKDITDVVIPICICDYVKNGEINFYDYIKFQQAYAGEYDVYCDLVVNNQVDFYDYIKFQQFYNAGTITYADLSLD